MIKLNGLNDHGEILVNPKYVVSIEKSRYTDTTCVYLIDHNIEVVESLEEVKWLIEGAKI